MPDGTWTIPTSNPDYSLNALQLCVQIAGQPYHTRIAPAKELLCNETVAPRFISGGGVYYANPQTYIDGQNVPFTFNNAGELLTTAAVTVIGTFTPAPTVWTERFYHEYIDGVDPIGVGDTTISFGFVGGDTRSDEIVIANDDNTNPIWINYNAPATADATCDKILPKEKFVDQFGSTNIHIIALADISAVRVWARKQL